MCGAHRVVVPWVGWSVWYRRRIHRLRRRFNSVHFLVMMLCEPTSSFAPSSSRSIRCFSCLPKWNKKPCFILLRLKESECMCVCESASECTLYFVQERTWKSPTNARLLLINLMEDSSELSKARECEFLSFSWCVCSSSFRYSQVYFLCILRIFFVVYRYINTHFLAK